MSYLSIPNLYRPEGQDVLLFRECYALEKIHGTSAHLKWNEGVITYFSGGEAHEKFKSLFDENQLKADFVALGHPEVSVFGEAYGGKQQGMKDTYGQRLMFIVFDVKIGDSWLLVPQMHAVACTLGLEVVPWIKVATDLALLDAERDKPSEVAQRRGCGEKPREGVVLRPPIEVTKNNGERIIAKHKNDAFKETATPRPVVDPSKLAVLQEATAIADEWTTPMRLQHVLQKFPTDVDMKATREVIAAMIADIEKESAGEIEWSDAAKGAIGKKTSILLRQHLSDKLRQAKP